jgi:hypothetical protein
VNDNKIAQLLKMVESDIYDMIQSKAISKEMFFEYLSGRDYENQQFFEEMNNEFKRI